MKLTRLLFRKGMFYYGSRAFNQKSSAKLENHVNSTISLKHVCRPSLNTAEIEKISSVLSLNIGLTHIGWTRIETKEYHLTHIGHVMLHENFNKKELNDMYSMVSQIVNSLPHASLYVMESISKLAKGGHTQMSFQASYLQMVAIILTLLNTNRPSITESQAVVFLKARLPGILFDLLIGTEVVSSESLVNKLMDGESINKMSVMKPSTQSLKIYNAASSVEKEIYGRALLAGLTFLELIVHKNNECYKKLLGESL